MHINYLHYQTHSYIGIWEKQNDKVNHSLAIVKTYARLDNFNINTDDNKRQLYVAITRAKQNLSIHYNGVYLNGLQIDGCEYQTNQVQYASVSQLTCHLTHKDIVLDYLDYIQPRIN